MSIPSKRSRYRCHWGTEMAYDYFLNIHNWDSSVVKGSKLISYVHFGEDYINAFWNGAWSAMEMGMQLWLFSFLPWTS